MIDGLQRISTILEFVGILRNGDGELYPPSVLEGTRYLPSLAGKSWEGVAKSKSVGSTNQISIKRARINIQILKKNSDPKAKYDLFQRLNSHGSVATPQELRNSIIYMINPNMFKAMQERASRPEFIKLIHPTDRLSETQGLMDFVTRFLVFNYIEYDTAWDIEEYLDNGLIELSDLSEENVEILMESFDTAVELLNSTGEENILRPYKDGSFKGRVGQAAFETIFFGCFAKCGIYLCKKEPFGFHTF